MTEPFLHNQDSAALSVQARVDAVCLRFEEAWKAGRRPRVEDYLKGTPEADRPVLLRELLRLELEYRGQRGETPILEEYRPYFPEYLDLRHVFFPQATRPELLRSPSFQPSGARNPSGTEGTPTRAGPYLLQEEVARGAMGVVYRAQDPDLNRPLRRKSAKVAQDLKEVLQLKGCPMAEEFHP
ncbi:MAG: hypothetical protein JO112_12695 [Planctomycetes bacterium]|nr:hypothetical protein [Planctomycetota bacterium]